jgi:methylthioribose-1-phosphate isomerase
MSELKAPGIILQGVFAPGLFDELKKRKVPEALVMEGRPSLEAARTNCRELLKRGIRPTLISDNMAGILFYKQLIREVWLACQHADEDGAICHVGGLILGVLGKRHGVPVRLFAAARKTGFLGADKELLHFQKTRVAPAGTKAYVPLVEWVPSKYITPGNGFRFGV